MSITELGLFNAFGVGIILAGLIVAMGQGRKKEGLPFIVFMIMAISTFGLFATLFFN